MFSGWLGQIADRAGAVRDTAEKAADNVPPTYPAGSGFTFDLAGIDAVLPKWEQLLADLMADNDIAQRMVAVDGPGDEPASRGMASHANFSGDAFLRHNMSMQMFVSDYLTNLRKAREQYLASDQTSAQTYGAQG